MKLPRSIALALCLAIIVLFNSAQIINEPYDQQVLASEPTLEQQILSATGIARSVSLELQAIAAARVQAIQTDFSHNNAGYAFGQAEVIGWNRGYENPLAAVVAGWLASPPHADVLLDPYYTQIGCAWSTDTVRTTTWLVCWFQRTDVPAPVIHPPIIPPVKPVVVVVLPPYVGSLPDTAMPK